MRTLETGLDHKLGGEGGYRAWVAVCKILDKLPLDKFSALKEAWQAYLQDSGEEEKKVENLMKKLISPPLSLDADKTYLFRAEMNHLKGFWGSDELTFSILVMACGNIWLGQSKERMAFKEQVAEWFIEFEKHDLDKDQYLNREEFSGLVNDVFGPIADKTKIFEELKKVDCDFHGGVLNFEEYATWRWICEQSINPFECRVPKDKQKDGEKQGHSECKGESEQ